MYTKTIIENEKELIHALLKDRCISDKFPRLDKVDLIFDGNPSELRLVTNDFEFDISKVDPLEFLREVLKKNNVNLNVIVTVSE